MTSAVSQRLISISTLFFDGEANVKGMLYDRSRDWQKSLMRYDNTWWGYQDHHFVEVYRDWLDAYWAVMLPEEKICLLSNQSKIENKLKKRIPKREIRTLPPNREFSSTIWVLGDYIITIMTRQKPHYAVQLQDSIFAANLRLVFQMLWEAAPH